MNKKEALHIRDYKEKDFPRLAEIWEQTGISTPGRGDTAALIQHTLEHGGKLLLLEAEDAGVIGSSWLTNDGRRLYLHHFAIAPEFQGRGWSKPLLRASLKFAKATGLQLKLEVHQDNERALNLYKKAGFGRLGDYDVYIIRDLGKVKE